MGPFRGQGKMITPLAGDNAPILQETRGINIWESSGRRHQYMRIAAGGINTRENPGRGHQNVREFLPAASIQQRILAGGISTWENPGRGHHYLRELRPGAPIHERIPAGGIIHHFARYSLFNIQMQKNIMISQISFEWIIYSPLEIDWLATAEFFF